MSALVDEALRLVRTRAYFADRVDWATLTSEISRVLAGGADLTRALRPVWRALGDGHSHLVRHQQVRAAPRAGIERPVGYRLADGLGYLRLPSFGDWYRAPAAGDYVNGVWTWLREHPAPGWVVDLRGNSGGSLVPMFAAIGPLLGPGQWLSYRRRDCSMQSYDYCAGELRIGGHSVLVAENAPADTPTLPVAVLIDRRTASAGEGILVAFHGRTSTLSFGAPTAGVPTGNVCHRLADGSVIAITESVAIDRFGHAYAKAIDPDFPGGLSAAQTWLSSQLPD